MKRIDIYLKVRMETTGEDNAEKLAGEICRQILRMYGIRSAEMVNYVLQE